MLKRFYGFATSYYHPDDPNRRADMFIQFEPAPEAMQSIGAAAGITFTAELLDKLVELLKTYRRNYLLDTRAPRPKQIRESLAEIGKDADRLFKSLSNLMRARTPAGGAALFALGVDGGFLSDRVEKLCLTIGILGSAVRRVLNKAKEMEDRGGRGGDPSLHWFIRELEETYVAAGGTGKYTWDCDGYAGPFFDFLEATMGIIPDRPKLTESALAKEMVRALKDKTKKKI